VKKGLLLAIFSLLALAPYTCVLAQASNNTPALKAVEKPSAGVSSTSDERKIQDPSAAVENGANKNQTISPTLSESTEAISNVRLKAASEAQRNYNAGVTLYDADKPDEAIRALKEANKLKPNDPQTHYMLGMAYWKATIYKNALDCFKRAVRLKPDWAEAYFRLGLTYYVLGRRSEANKTYEKLLKLDSPLAKKFYRISNYSNPNTIAGNPAPESAASTTKQVAVRTVSTPVAVVPAKRTEKHDSTSSAKAVAGNDSALTDVYRVGPGDVLDIRLLNSATNRSNLYTVIEGGLIDLPFAGAPIPVAGLTTNEIQARITARLKSLAVEGQPQVAVGVRQYASHTVFITGLARNPGTKILRREGVPLYVILAEAQPSVDAARAVVIRAGSPAQVVDLTDSAAFNLIVRPGDVINLTARPQDFYYIAGRISYPGQKPFQPGITLVQAILAAGGSTRDNVAELSRRGSNSRLAATKFKLKEIKSGKIQDPRLQAGDRIEVLH
jgi:protein involved in polysaccharide export with SLBB domain